MIEAFFMPAHCYILYSPKPGKYYIGSTIDIERRLAEHNRGKEKFTQRGMPWLLVYKEEFVEPLKTRQRKLYVKKIKRLLYA